MPMFVQYQIFTNLPLVEGEEAFENWKRPPVTPTMSLYVFNFTNTQAFLAGKKNSSNQNGYFTTLISRKMFD